MREGETIIGIRCKVKGREMILIFPKKEGEKREVVTVLDVEGEEEVEDERIFVLQRKEREFQISDGKVTIRI